MIGNATPVVRIRDYQDRSSADAQTHGVHAHKRRHTCKLECLHFLWSLRSQVPDPGQDRNELNPLGRKSSTSMFMPLLPMLWVRRRSRPATDNSFSLAGIRDSLYR
jgi:hypothetical protein